MFYAYVLKSLHHDYFYKGHCKDLKKRLQEHNNKQTKSNKRYAPFIIAYYEGFNILEEAIAREKYFKSAAGRRYLKEKLTR